MDTICPWDYEKIKASLTSAVGTTRDSSLYEKEGSNELPAELRLQLLRKTRSSLETAALWPNYIPPKSLQKVIKQISTIVSDCTAKGKCFVFSGTQPDVIATLGVFVTTAFSLTTGSPAACLHTFWFDAAAKAFAEQRLGDGSFIPGFPTGSPPLLISLIEPLLGRAHDPGFGLGNHMLRSWAFRNTTFAFFLTFSGKWGGSSNALFFDKLKARFGPDVGIMLQNKMEVHLIPKLTIEPKPSVVTMLGN